MKRMLVSSFSPTSYWDDEAATRGPTGPEK
jgi:hypothetical protein